MDEAPRLAPLLNLVRQICERIPFNRLLGLQVESLDPARPRVRLAMRPELVGNFIRGSLHGGVISSTLDFTGGLVAYLGVLQALPEEPPAELAARFARIGTIDLRVDYLRPGIGREFTATGWALRTGKKVAVTRMEMHTEAGVLIAVGTGAYTVA